MQGPNERRGFVHRRLAGAARNFVTSGFNPTAAAGGFFNPVGGGGGGVDAQSPQGINRRVGGSPNQFTGPAGVQRFGNLAAGGCPPGTRRFPDGHCHSRAVAIIRHPGDSQGAAPGGAPFSDAVPMGATGQAVMGRYGAGMVPHPEQRVTRTCLPGMVLGNDGICYNKRDIRNADRAHPKGTRPLGTPGEMAALRKAASFGRRMETTVKRMQKVGVLKKPAPRRHTHKTTHSH